MSAKIREDMHDVTVNDDEVHAPVQADDNIKTFTLEDDIYQVTTRDTLDQVYAKLVNLKKRGSDFDNILRLNSCVRVFTACLKEGKYTELHEILTHHQHNIDHAVSFSYEKGSAAELTKLFKIVNCFDDERHYKYIDFAGLREIMTEEFILRYLEYQLFADQCEPEYEVLLGFHSAVLTAHNILYFKAQKAMMTRLDPQVLFGIDPFMRIACRMRNSATYWDITVPRFNHDQMFDFVRFLLESYILRESPRWQIANGRPLLIPLLELIHLMFVYGLVPYDRAKVMLRYLYLISEILRDYEHLFKEFSSENVFDQKCRGELFKCRFYVSNILVSVYMLMADETLEEQLREHMKLAKKQKRLRCTIIEDKSSYNYFCSIVVKYLSDNNDMFKKEFSPDDNIEHYHELTVVHDRNMTSLYRFIGNCKKDAFTISSNLCQIFSYRTLLIHALNLDRGYTNQSDECSNVIEACATALRHCSGGEIKPKLIVDMVMGAVESIIDFNAFSINSHKAVPSIADRSDNMLYKMRFNLRNSVANLLSIASAISYFRPVFFINGVFHAIELMVRDNHAAQMMLFTEEGFRDMQNINKFFSCDVSLLLNRIFVRDLTLVNINAEIFHMQLDLYRTNVNDLLLFMEDLDNLERLSQQCSKPGEEDAGKSINREDERYVIEFRKKVATVYYFQQYLDALLETHVLPADQQNHYDAMVAQVMLPLVVKYALPGLKKSERTECPRFPPEVTNPVIGKFAVVLKGFALIDQDEMLYRFYYWTVKLFNKATYKSYYLNVCRAVSPLIYKIGEYTADNVYVRTEFVKLYERFMIFSTNNLIDINLELKSEPTMVNCEYFETKRCNDIAEYLNAQFNWLEKHLANLGSKARELGDESYIAQKFAFKCLLPLVYKLLKGFNYHINKTSDVKLIENLQSLIISIIEAVISFGQKISTVNAEFRRMNIKIPGERVANKNPTQLISRYIRAKVFKNKIKPNRKGQLHFYSIDEERIKPLLRDLRMRLYDGIAVIERLYEKSTFEYCISRFIREPLDDDTTDYMRLELTSSDHIRSKLAEDAIKVAPLPKAKRYSDNLWKNFVQRYINTKITYQNKKETNQFYIAINTANDKVKDIRNIVKYFIERFESVTSQPASDIIHRYFLNDEFFFLAITILDNINVTNSLVKKVMVERLHTQPKAKREMFINKMWNVLLSLYQIVTYKTFMDEDWERFWSLYYLISMFWDNLCNETTPYVKLYFSDDTKEQYELQPVLSGYGKRATMFTETVRMLEGMIDFTQVGLNDSAEIGPSDRAELFPLLVKLFQRTTNFYTGPCHINQIRKHGARLDIWSNILYRVIDDIDSRFYEVKLACLQYFQALTDGLHEDSLEVIKPVLQINDMYALIMRLTKKLFVRYKLSRLSYKKPKFVQDNTKMMTQNEFRFENTAMRNKSSAAKVSIVTAADEAKCNIGSSSRLITMYKKLPTIFSDHVVLNVVITLYIMMINMSFKIKFYQFFLKEKKKEAKNAIKGNIKLDRERRNDVMIYYFLQQITTNIEVVYETDTQVELKRHFYRTSPECLFLQAETKRDFIKNVDISSTRNKQIDLLDSVDEFMLEMKQCKRGYERFSFLFYFATSSFYKYNQMFIYVACVALNCIMLAYLNDLGEGPGKNLTTNHAIGKKIIKYLALGITAYSGFFCICWFFFIHGNEASKARARYISMYKTIKPRQEFILKYVHSLIIHPRFCAFLLHTIFTLIGLLTKDAFFFTLNLFLITNLLKPITYIMKSIVLHYGKLISTFVAMLLVIFVYSFILMTSYNGQFQSGEKDTPCGNFSHCFFNSVNSGLRAGGGVSDLLNQITGFDNKGMFYSRLIFDVTFFILIKLVFLNLIGGIIIDTFSEMRDELTVRTNDEENICFICGKERGDVTREGVDFDKHTERDHNIWKYVNFIVRLKSMDISSLTAAEKQIYEKIHADDPSWMPIEAYLKKSENLRVLETK